MLLFILIPIKENNISINLDIQSQHFKCQSLITLARQKFEFRFSVHKCTGK